jgi:hypothetical protein
VTVRVSREHNGSAPKLYIEFEDDEAASEPGEAKLVSEREVVGGSPMRPIADWRPRRARTLAALAPRYRKLAAGVVVFAGLAATVSNALVAQAAQRQAARSTVTVVDAAYSASADDLSLNLLVDLADSSPSTVTVTQLEAHQSDLNLSYNGMPVSLNGTQQLEIVLSGAYDCSPGTLNGAAPAKTDSHPGVLHMTVRTVQGNVTSVDVPLPANAQLPDHWRSGRAAYCAVFWAAD